MSGPKWTPGPWFAVADVKYDDDLGITAQSRTDMIDIANIGVGYDGKIEVEQRANVHLIISAPELYETLLSAVADLQVLAKRTVGTELQVWIDKRLPVFLSMLAKARGETP